MKRHSIFAVIGDTHYGARSNSPIFAFHQRRFFKEVFWPSIDKLKCEHIIHAGDVFDTGTSINTQALALANECLIHPAIERNIHIDIILGNHDLSLRQKMQPNIVEEAWRPLQDHGILIYDRPGVCHVHDNIGLIPWITDDNADDTAEFLLNTKVEYLIGHLEVVGGMMNDRRICEKGFDAKTFKRFKGVYSGHFHRPSKVGRVEYFSSPLDLRWDEYGVRHGFMLWHDDGKGTVSYVETPWSVHRVLEAPQPFQNVENCIVKVRSEGRPDPDYIESLRINGVADLSIEDTSPIHHADSDLLTEDDECQELPETRILIQEYIEQDGNISVDKNSLSDLMDELYIEVV
jgi:DNA repair exonuclease SbcCD nuclease subunit